MAEDLATPPNTLVQIRWKEPYVSQGLNKKLHGLIPAGVIRGGRLTTSALNSHVTVEADPDSGDSVYSFIDANNHQMTFRQAGDVVLDLDVGALPGTTVYVGLEVVYSVSAQTEIYWRAYSQAEVDADPTLVILGSVAVPGVPALIPTTDILYDRRRDAGLNLSTGMRDWRQVIQNPSFEGPADTISSGEEREFFGWVFEALFAGTWRVLSPGSGPASQPHSGDNSLVAVGGGGGAHLMTATPLGVHRVSPGQTVKVSVWVRGDSVALGSGASASVGFWIKAFEWDGSDVSDPSPWGSGSLFIVEDGTVINGSFGYLEISGEFKVPEDASFIQPIIMVNDAASFSGTIEFDDVQVWLEPGPVHLPYDRKTDLISPEIMTHGLAVAPLLGQGGISEDPSQIWQRALRLFCSVAASSDLEHEWGMVKPSITRWLMTLNRGRLQVGKDLYGSAGDAALPRVKNLAAAAATADYTCLWESEPVDINTPGVRLYHSIASAYDTGFVLTVNAKWTGSEWEADDQGATTGAARYGFDQYGDFECYFRYDTSSNWADGAWSYLAWNFDHYAPSEYVDLNMRDARIDISDPTGGTLSHSSPSYNTTIRNEICSLNTCKAWGVVRLSSNSPYIFIYPEGSPEFAHHLSSVSILTEGGKKLARFNLTTTMDVNTETGHDKGYAVVVGYDPGDQPVTAIDWVWNPKVRVIDDNTFDIALVDDAGNFDSLDLGRQQLFYFAVFARTA